MDKEDFISRGVFDIPEEVYSDDSININKYLNVAILTAQKILPNATLKGNLDDGLLAYSLQIDQAEMFAQAGNYLSEAYETDLKAYKNTQEFKSITREGVKMAKLANKKLFLIMREIGEKAPSHVPMKA